jgi:hypothetical protein
VTGKFAEQRKSRIALSVLEYIIKSSPLHFDVNCISYNLVRIDNSVIKRGFLKFLTIFEKVEIMMREHTPQIANRDLNLLTHFFLYLLSEGALGSLHYHPLCYCLYITPL